MGELDKDLISDMFDVFFCKTCLEDRPIREQSYDKRYCLKCADFLEEEAKRLPEGKRPRWTPRQNRQKQGQ